MYIIMRETHAEQKGGKDDEQPVITEALLQDGAHMSLQSRKCQVRRTSAVTSE